LTATPKINNKFVATDLYRKTKDIVVVKNALGHNSISTTQICVHLVGSDVEKVLSGQLYPNA